VSAQSDVLDALALCRRTHANLIRNVARHRLAADVLAKIDPAASESCKRAATLLMLELVAVRADLRRVEELAEMTR